MIRLVSRLFLLFLLTSLAHTSRAAFTDCASVTGMTPSDCEALVAFYGGANGVNWTTSTDWLQTETPCTWFGVTCTGDRVSALILDDNNLAGTVPAQFGNLTALTTLDLSDNLLTSLPEEFGNLVNLTTLDLFYSLGLSSLPASFGNLDNLTTLDLRVSALMSLPDSFGGLSSLTTLHLTYSYGVTTLPATFGDLANLTTLDLSWNHLTALPASFGNLDNLQFLDLHNNSLSGLPSSFGSLPALQTLYLNHNNFSKLPSVIGSLTALTSLDVSWNQLTDLPASLGNLTQLEALDLDYNNLSVVPAVVSGLSTLEYLNLAHNRLTSLPAGFGNYPQMVDLILGFNRLTSLPASIGNMPVLYNLNLSNNLLSSLPASFSNLTSIAYVNLSHNRLTQFPPVATPSGIQFLSLNGNRLTSLPASFTAANFPGLLPVSNNPWLTTGYFGGNALVINDANVTAFLDSIDPSWRDWQISTPTDFHVENYDAATGEITFAWTPIPFSDYAGKYIIGCGSDPATPFNRYAVSTFDKADSQIKMFGLVKGTYHCAIRTTNDYNTVNYNALSSPPSPAIPVNVTTAVTVVNDKPGNAVQITETRYGYFLGEFSRATAEANNMPIPTNCGVTATMKSVYFEIPASGTRVPGHFVRGRVTVVTGGPDHFVNNNQKTDTILAVYRRTGSGTWRLVRCNDNAFPDGASKLDLNINPAIRYRVVVWGKSGVNLKSLILQSLASNITNSGAEQNTDSDPLLPDGWTASNLDSSPATLDSSIINCTPSLARTGNCAAVIRSGNWAYINIPVDPEFSASLMAGDKIRVTAYVRRRNVESSVFCYCTNSAPAMTVYIGTPSNPGPEPVIAIDQGHDSRYWKVISSSVTMDGPVINLTLLIVTYANGTQGIERGTILVDDLSIEVQRAASRDWIPLPPAP